MQVFNLRLLNFQRSMRAMKRACSTIIPFVSGLLALAACSSAPVSQDSFRGPASEVVRINRIGTFAAIHEIALSTPSQTDCEASEGRWDGKACLFKTIDEVTVRDRDGRAHVHVAVTSPNGQECEFESFADAPTAYKLLARAADSLGDCTVGITYANSNKLSVVADDACGCPKGVDLSIREAIRIKKFFH